MHPRNKGERFEIGKRKLEKLAYETKHSYRGGVYYDDYKGRILRYWIGKRFLKKERSKATRRMKDISNGSMYKKAFDYWWAVL